MNIVVIIILVIGAISMAGFSQPELMEKYQFNAWRILKNKEYIRLLSHGFFHGSWMHLFINMFVLYSFGKAVIHYFSHSIAMNSNLLFLIFFISAIIISSLYSLSKEKNNPYYNALGASGAVSAVVFATIFYAPYQPIYLFAIIKIPGIILGVVFLVYSRIMAQKNNDNIGHDAHFWGAVYGFIFPAVLNTDLIAVFFKKLLFL
ncbi:rhomboid family intramembrane serine protease [Marinilabiliaceae bacterium JC017]|nr:rhomboid family intramembrane serine protease [Marinilabiliaceae bacterium JC017]